MFIKRLCSLRDYTVIGGASRLWKYFVDKYSPKSVISYANRRFSNGEIYKKLGFEFIKNTKPNYYYFKLPSLKLQSRNKYQKHKLRNLHSEGILEFYDEKLSEEQNMLNNNFRKIYDCGNIKFIWKGNN